jgi:hypothetical protein
MLALEEVILYGDKDSSWKLVKSWLGLEQRKKALSQITYVVCKHFWWLSGEWFWITGSLGWNTGFKDWEDVSMLYPPPLADCKTQLRWFLNDLCDIRPSKQVTEMLEYADKQKYVHEASNSNLQILATLRSSFIGRTVAFALYDDMASVGSPQEVLLDKVIEYRLGMCRPFLWMLEGNKWWRIGLVGMLLIYQMSLTRHQVLMKKVTEKRVAALVDEADLREIFGD